MIKNDTRMILHAFFRQQWKFAAIFVPVILAGLLYILFATTEYESTAKLLVKFGEDNLPKLAGQNAQAENSSINEHHELVQSNVNILSSRDLAEALLKDITIARAYPALAENPPSRGTLMDAAVKKLSDDLTIKTESDSDVITVGLFNKDPEVAREMALRLIDLFITRQSEIYANPQTEILHTQEMAARDKLQMVQKDLYDYKTQAGIASVDDELGLLLKQRSDLAEDLLAKERFYALYKTNKAGDPAVAAIYGQRKSLDKQIAGLEQRKAHYDDLMREVRLAEENYRTRQARMEDAEASQGMNQQKVTHIAVIEQPTLPYKPGRPSKMIIIALCLLVGFALGFSTCILAENFDQRFSFPEQAAQALGVPVLGSFPYRTERSEAA